MYIIWAEYNETDHETRNCIAASLVSCLVLEARRRPQPGSPQSCHVSLAARGSPLTGGQRMFTTNPPNGVESWGAGMLSAQIIYYCRLDMQQASLQTYKQTKRQV